MDPASTSALFELVKGFGTASPIIGLLVYLFLAERSERRDLTSRFIDQNSQAITAENKMTSALEALADRVKPGGTL